MKKIANLLCVVEPEDNSVSALKHAERLAEQYQAKLILLSPLDTTLPFNLQLKSSGREINHDFVAEAKKKVVEQWLVSTGFSHSNAELEVVSGTPFLETIKLVLERDIDLVVKCSDDPEWTDRLFGSDDMHLLRKCPCPVLMLKPGQGPVFRNVMATVDVNGEVEDKDAERVQESLNEKVLEYSVSICLAQLTEFHIGSVWQALGEDFLRYGVFSPMQKEEVDLYVERYYKDRSNKLDELVGKLDKLVGQSAVEYVKPRVHLVKGKAASEIPVMAREHNIDLIVMGTVARTGVSGFLIGNTAETILEQVNCSVLAIKPDGFETPVRI